MYKHVFSFYKEGLKDLQLEKEFCIKDKDLSNRLTKVVRIKPDESCILFDDKINITIKIFFKTFDNKNVIYGQILKTEALKHSFYVAAQMGVSHIILIQTDKSSSIKNIEKNYNRFHKIMISACEQSKNFIPPQILPPSSLKDAINKLDQSTKICFYEHGEHIKKCTQSTITNPIAVTLGPEGGFSKDEIEFLQKSEFSLYKLTPTILRSREAICVGLGI